MNLDYTTFYNSTINDSRDNEDSFDGEGPIERVEILFSSSSRNSLAILEHFSMTDQDTNKRLFFRSKINRCVMSSGQQHFAMQNMDGVIPSELLNASTLGEIVKKGVTIMLQRNRPVKYLESLLTSRDVW